MRKILMFVCVALCLVSCGDDDEPMSTVNSNSGTVTINDENYTWFIGKDSYDEEDCSIPETNIVEEYEDETCFLGWFYTPNPPLLGPWNYRLWLDVEPFNYKATPKGTRLKIVDLDIYRSLEDTWGRSHEFLRGYVTFEGIYDNKYVELCFHDAQIVISLVFVEVHHPDVYITINGTVRFELE